MTAKKRGPAPEILQTRCLRCGELIYGLGFCTPGCLVGAEAHRPLKTMQYEIFRRVYKRPLKKSEQRHR